MSRRKQQDKIRPLTRLLPCPSQPSAAVEVDAHSGQRRKVHRWQQAYGAVRRLFADTPSRDRRVDPGLYYARAHAPDPVPWLFLDPCPCPALFPYPFPYPGHVPGNDTPDCPSSPASPLATLPPPLSPSVAYKAEGSNGDVKANGHVHSTRHGGVPLGIALRLRIR